MCRSSTRGRSRVSTCRWLSAEPASSTSPARRCALIHGNSTTRSSKPMPKPVRQAARPSGSGRAARRRRARARRSRGALGVGLVPRLARGRLGPAAATSLGAPVGEAGRKPAAASSARWTCELRAAARRPARRGRRSARVAAAQLRAPRAARRGLGELRRVGHRGLDLRVAHGLAQVLGLLAAAPTARSRSTVRACAVYGFISRSASRRAKRRGRAERRARRRRRDRDRCARAARRRLGDAGERRRRRRARRGAPSSVARRRAMRAPAA